jgi:hypothetical protein
MPDDDQYQKTPSGLHLEDTRTLYRAFNRLAAEIASADIGYATLARRLRVIAGWCGEAADDLQGRSAEERGVAETDDFWARRKAGERNVQD